MTKKSCIYMKVNGSFFFFFVFLVLYVDDIMTVGNSVPMIELVKAWLSSYFSMKDLGEAQYILGIRIYRDRSKRMIRLSQSTYIDKIVNKFNIVNFDKGFLPMSHSISLSKKQCPLTPDEL